MWRKYLLIICAAFLIVYLSLAAYILIKRPVISLPTIHYSVEEGNVLYKLLGILAVKDQISLEIITNGKLSFMQDNVELTEISFNPSSFGNTVVLGSRYVIPKNLSWILKGIDFMFPSIRGKLNLTGFFFYYIMPLKLTIQIAYAE